MLTGFANKTADAASPAIESASHLLHIVQRVLAAQDNVHISLPGSGYIIILPQKREYHADVADMAQFCIAPTSAFEIKPMDNAAISALSKSGKDVRDLLWQLAFHIYEENLIENCSENDVVQFRRWPNLTRLPVTANTARICALLTRHPTSIMLVRRVLSIDKKEVSRIISAAYCAGIVNTISRGPSQTHAEPTVSEIKPEQSAKSGVWNSLFAKISSL